MTKTTATIIMMLALACHANAQTPSPLDVKELKLSNGMTVWLNEDHSQPKVYGAVVVNAGAKDCPNTGIAHYFEHILFKGTETIGTIDYIQEKPWLDSISARYDQLAATRDEQQRSTIQKDINRLSQKAGEYAIPNEFNRLISKYGGSDLNAATSWDFTYYHNAFTPQYLEHWCWLNSERMINPVFRLFQGELETVYEEKNMYADNMLVTAGENLMSELFGTLPYAYPIIGSTENLKNPRLSEMRQFYSQYYVGCNMGLVLCGDINTDGLLPLLERTFGRIPQGTPPHHAKSPLPDITQERTVEIKLPIPLVNIELLAYKAPTEYELSANALKIALQLLYNGQAGMLDSLTNENQVMTAMAMTQSLNDAGVALILLVPNLLGSTSKAEKACLEQVERLCKGEFSESRFINEKQEAFREASRELETISTRATKMVSVMASGHSWQDYVDKVRAIDKLTKDDIVAVSKRYFKAPFVRFKKKKGNYPKDKISQPDYTPVTPKNKNAESEYARYLSKLTVEERDPRLLDFAHDATITPLCGQATLYTVKNEINDLFELTISYNRGEKADPRLGATCELLNTIGTDSLSRQQFASALQAYGADMTFTSDASSVKLLVVGVDKHLKPTMQLVNHFLNHAKANAKAISQINNNKKAESKSESKENSDVMRALRLKMMYGDNSTYLRRLTLAESKKLTGEEMFSAFNDVTTSACDIIYSGSLANNEVESIVRSTLPIERSQKPYIDYTDDVINYEEPTVYIYDMPRSRQTLFLTYEQVPALPTLESRVPFMLLKDYFGGGMSSVLFQEVREFRSMAYSAGSYYTMRSRHTAPNSPLCFGTIVGTQGDKAMKAIELVDSLLRDMPLLEKNFDTSRQEAINELSTQFPSFRNIGIHIANLRSKGFDRDNNTGLAQLFRKAKMEDMQRYYQEHIQHNQRHRALGIVGDKSKLNINELSKYGKVVFLKESDLFRK